MILAFQANSPGSNPGRCIRARGLVGMTSPSHGGGPEFESQRAHWKSPIRTRMGLDWEKGVLDEDIYHFGGVVARIFQEFYGIF